MPESPQASSLAELERALSASHPDRTAEAALRALHDRIPPLEILRSAASTAASRYDPASGLPPHGLATLSAAALMGDWMDPRDLPLAILQAAVLAASEKKLASAQPLARIVAGEVTHVGRSALLAARAGAAADAEPLFLGILEEGWERRMAGDLLFRASLEDCGDAGHKFLISVEAWQLARALGFRDSRTILRPAVQYLLRGERNVELHQTTLGLFGKAGVDLASLSSDGRPLDDDGRARLATLLAGPTDEACVSGLLGLLHEGYAALSLATVVSAEAAKRLLAAEGYHIELVHILLFTRAARFVLEFSRSEERLLALFEAALRVRSPAPHLPSVAVAEAPDGTAALRQIADDLRTRRSREAAADVRNYLARGFPPPALQTLLARYAALDSSLANQGHNLILAEACLSEHAATKAPEFLMALAKSVAASPMDLMASTAWAVALAA